MSHTEYLFGFTGRKTAMDKSELLELAENGNLISGIYNYCDRWCERCPFTSRCLVYATEKADIELDDPEVRDINNAKFWRKLESMFREAHEMISAWAEEAGIDLDAVEIETAEARRKQRNAAKLHELSVSARRYAQMVQ